MSEQDWADEPAVPPKKKGLPGWVLFCGAGCLILMVLGAIGAYFAVKEVQQMVDPEAQWARLDESLPMDERPPELNMMFGMGIGIDMWMISDNRGYIAAVYDFGESEAEGRDEIFSEDFTGGGVPGMNQIEDPELGEVVVQGRTLPILSQPSSRKMCAERRLGNPKANTQPRLADSAMAARSRALNRPRLRQDGTVMTSPVSPTAMVAAKVLAHWLTTGLPLTVLAPLLGVTLQMPSSSTIPMMTALLLGTPTLSLIGAVGAALTLGARRRGVLMPLVILPLYIPILIFGVGAIDASVMGFEAQGLYAVLGGFLLISAALCPWAASVAVRISAE